MAIPVLQPGTSAPGSWQATLQPAAVGSAGNYGYTAKAIARWDIIPYQTFSATFDIGVVSYHCAEIDRVEFAVNGGEWQSVDAMSLNNRTNELEYTVQLDASLFASSGPVEVRAVAYPVVGIPLVLDSMYLVVDKGNLTWPVRYVDSTSTLPINTVTGSLPTFGDMVTGSTSGAIGLFCTMDDTTHMRLSLVKTVMIIGTYAGAAPVVGNLITGQTSGAKAAIHAVSGSSITVVVLGGTFTVGEEIQWVSASNHAPLSAHVVFQDGESLIWTSGSSSVAGTASLNGSDLWDGTSATFVGGSVGPKSSPYNAAVSARDAQGRVDGLTIYLNKGHYHTGPVTSPRSQTWYRWVTLTPSNGLNRNDVVFYGSFSSVMYTHLTRLEGLRITTYSSDVNHIYTITGSTQADGDSNFDAVSAQEPYTRIWFNDCLFDRGINSQQIQVAGYTHRYATDTRFETLRACLNSCTFLRNCTAANIGADTWTDCLFGLHLTVESTNPYDPVNVHPDGLQWNRQANNVIIRDFLLNTTADHQGWIVGTSTTPTEDSSTNWAWINWTMNQPAVVDTNLKTQFAQNIDHWVVKNYQSMSKQEFLLRDNADNGDPTQFINLLFCDSTIPKLVATNTGNNVADDTTNRFAGNVFSAGTDWNNYSSNAAPSLSITSSSATYLHGSSHTIQATASDAEDGDLTDSIVWTSDIQGGTLGTGGELDTTVLDVGIHTLTATVTDAGGATASDTVQITILSAPKRSGFEQSVTVIGDPSNTENWQVIYDSEQDRNTCGTPFKTVWFKVTGTTGVNIHICGIHDVDGTRLFESHEPDGVEHERTAYRGDIGLITRIEVNAAVVGGKISWGPKSA